MDAQIPYLHWDRCYVKCCYVVLLGGNDKGNICVTSKQLCVFCMKCFRHVVDWLNERVWNSCRFRARSFSVKGVRLGRWEEISVGSEQCSPQGCWLNFLLFAKHLEQPQWNLLEPGLWLQWGATFLLLSLLPVLISENLTHSSDRYRKLEAPEELRCPLESEKQAPDPQCHCHC